MSRTPGLRAQLLVGLSLILVVATLSAGGIALWATRRQLLDVQVETCRTFGQGVAALLAPPLSAGERPALQRLVSSLAPSPLLQGLVVLDGHGAPLAASGSLLAPPAGVPLALLGQQQLRVREGAEPAVEVLSPLFHGARVVGVAQSSSLLGHGAYEWPGLFWALMAIDVVIIVLFVGFVLTRYVIGPLGALQRAATRVTGGDLEVRLATDGAAEFSSLAQSFNQMTESVQEQLRRLEGQQRELATSREHLIRSEKLASVGRLAAGVAHEVGNPLQSIIGFSDVLAAGGVPEQEAKDFLARIRDEAQRIHRIIRELLDYARPVEDAVEAVSLASVVEQSLQLVGPQRRLREVEVAREGLEDLPAVAANASRLVQVLVNLLLNAADAIAGKGTIYISGRRGPGPEQLELRVANTGPLIPPEHRGRIFDPFFTTKEPGQGTGLGLSVAQSIVESYGGRLLLVTEGPGSERTTFAIVLHVYASPAPAASAPASSAPAPSAPASPAPASSAPASPASP